MAGKMSERERERLGGEIYALRGPALAVARRVLGDDSRAEEACAESYLRAVARIETLPSLRDLKPWFLRVVLNTARSQAGSEAARRRREEKVMQEQHTESPSDRAARTELAALASQELGKLDEKQRLALSLHYEGGLTHAEVAGVLGVPPGTASSDISRGLERLRERLTSRGLGVAPAALAGALGVLSNAEVPAAFSATVKGIIAGKLGLDAAALSAASAAAGGAALAWKVFAGLAAVTAIGFGTWSGIRLTGPKPVTPAAAPKPAPESVKPAQLAPVGREELDRKICDILVSYKPGKSSELKKLLLEGYRRYADYHYLRSYIALAGPADADTVAGLLRRNDFPPGERRQSSGNVRREGLLRLLAALDRERARRLTRELWGKCEERDALVRVLAEIGKAEDMKWLFGQLRDGRLPGVKDTGYALAGGQKLPVEFRVEALVQFARFQPPKRKHRHAADPRTQGSITRIARTHANQAWLLLLKLKAAGADVKRAEEEFEKARKRMPALTAKNLRDWAQVGLDAAARGKLMALYPKIKGRRGSARFVLARVLAALWADGTGREWVDELAGGGARDKDVLVLACTHWEPMARRHVKLLEGVAGRPKQKVTMSDIARRKAREALAGVSLERALRMIGDRGISVWNTRKYLGAARTPEDFERVLKAVTSDELIAADRAVTVLRCTHPRWFDRHAEFAAAGRRFFEKHPDRLKSYLDNCFPKRLSAAARGNRAVLSRLRGTLSSLHYMEFGPVFAKMLDSQKEEDVIRALVYFNGIGRSHLMSWGTRITAASAGKRAAAFRKMSGKGKLRFLRYAPRYYAPPICAEFLKLLESRDAELAEAARQRLADYSQTEPAYLVVLYKAWLASKDPEKFALGAVCLGVRDRHAKGKFPELAGALSKRLPKLKGRALARGICAQTYIAPEPGMRRALAAWSKLDVRGRAALIKGLDRVRSWKGGLPEQQKLAALIVGDLAATQNLEYRWAAVGSRFIWTSLVRYSWNLAKGKRDPEMGKLEADVAAALPALIRDARDPELQRLAVHKVSSRLVGREPKIKTALEKVARSARGKSVKEAATWALKRLTEKKSEPRPQPPPEEPPEVF